MGAALDSRVMDSTLPRSDGVLKLITISHRWCKIRTAAVGKAYDMTGGNQREQSSLVFSMYV
jgi:hypothetical protein